jgi:hypothetical protein
MRLTKFISRLSTINGLKYSANILYFGGQISQLYRYNYGKIHGECVGYFYNDCIESIIYYNYSNNLMNYYKLIQYGHPTYYIKHIVEYDIDRKCIKNIYYNSDGSIKQNRIIPDRPGCFECFEYYPNGSIREKTTYVNMEQIEQIYYPE